MLFADESARVAETVNNMVTASRVATCPAFSIDMSFVDLTIVLWESFFRFHAITVFPAPSTYGLCGCSIVCVS
jgi:hypothetical protein